MTREELRYKAIRLVWHTLEFAGFLWNEDMLTKTVDFCLDNPYGDAEGLYARIAGETAPKFEGLDGPTRLPYMLAVAMIEAMRLQLLTPEKADCRRRCVLVRQSQFECGLAPGHKGPCVPAGGLPVQLVEGVGHE